MKTLLNLLLCCSLGFISCEEDSEDPSKFCSENPLEEIDWIKNLVDIEINSDLYNSSGLEIIQYEYQGDSAFSVDRCTNNCSDSLIAIYDCDKNPICEVGGIAGVNTCQDFFKEAKNETILFSSRNTSTSVYCDKGTIISAELFNSSKASNILKAKITDNCLHLNFVILSTQDRIADVNLIDAGFILESNPIQRNLKLVVKESLTKPTSIEVTTSFDISNLVAWDFRDEVILNIEGLDKPLRYNRVPQCGDPNVNCQANGQIAKREALDKLLLEIETIANTPQCIDPSDWAYTPLGSKSCGGPVQYKTVAKVNQILG